MKNQRQNIPRLPLPPLAKAGVLVRKIQHRRDGVESATSRPHRDSHYLLWLATQGQFTVHLDFEEVNFAAPALLLIFPGQVHHLVGTTQPQGWGVSFDPALLDAELQRTLEQSFVGPQVLNPKSAFFRQATRMMELMEDLQTNSSNTRTSQAIHALLTASLNLLIGLATPEHSRENPKESRASVIERAFRRLLEQHYKECKQPAYYAAKLAVSVAHLNDTVKQSTGRTVSVHIQTRAILEAKRLLGFTDLSVKEIGYEIGYNEPVYFGKVFKKNTGVTPLDFRRQFRD